MRFSASLLLRSCSAAALALSASSAFAHIDLLSPTSRYVVNRANGGGGSKECPCGGTLVDSDRVCNVPAAMSHDPNRSNKVTTFEAGSTITVRVQEYIDHSGRFRVAFDDDGADLADFNAHVLLDVADDKPPQIYEFSVKLPSTPCENCTLQVIQDMNGNTTRPVADPAPDSTYYSCADIRLVAAGTLGDAGSTSPAEGTGGTGYTTGSGGSASSGGTGNLGGMSPSGLGGRSGAAGASMSGMSGGSSGSGSAAPGSAGVGAAIPTASDADDGGGCSFEPQSPGRGWAWALAPLAVLLASTRRRRSARG